eukprot:320292_1
MCSLPIVDVLRLLSIYLAAILSMIIVGYQSLLPILQDENIFSSLCKDESTSCNAQDLRLDMMYNISITAINGMCIFWGLLCLHYGPIPGILIGGTILTTAALIFSFGWDWGCFFSYIALGAGNGGLILGVIGIPSEYPKIQGLLFSILVGCLDASSGIAYIFLLLYKYYLYNVFK